MKIQNEHCLLCKKIASPSMGNLSQYWFCNDCILGWIKVIPKTSYKDEYYISGSSRLSKLFVPLGSIFYKIREAQVGFLQKKLWLDVGAGEGSYVEKVHAEKKIGVEVSDSGRQIMKRKNLIVMTNNEYLKVKNLNADVISFWHVLEHVVNPQAYIRAAQENLSQSGKIIIAVPNIDSLEFFVFGKFWFHLAPQYHIWFFSPKSLKKMLAKTNLKIEKVDYWAIEHQLTGMLQSFINATTHTDNILHKLIRRRQDFVNLQVSQIFWIVFWCTLGFPIVILFWIFSAVLHKPGAFVLVASKK